MLVDTTVWVDHLRRGDEVLVGLLEHLQVTVHPFVVGELAFGHIRNRPADAAGEKLLTRDRRLEGAAESLGQA